MTIGFPVIMSFTSLRVERNTKIKVVHVTRAVGCTKKIHLKTYHLQRWWNYILLDFHLDPHPRRWQKLSQKEILCLDWSYLWCWLSQSCPWTPLDTSERLVTHCSWSQRQSGIVWQQVFHRLRKVDQNLKQWYRFYDKRTSFLKVELLKGSVMDLLLSIR